MKKVYLISALSLLSASAFSASRADNCSTVQRKGIEVTSCVKILGSQPKGFRRQDRANIASMVNRNVQNTIKKILSQKPPAKPPVPTPAPLPAPTPILTEQQVINLTDIESGPSVPSTNTDVSGIPTNTDVSGIPTNIDVSGIPTNIDVSGIMSPNSAPPAYPLTVF